MNKFTDNGHTYRLACVAAAFVIAGVLLCVLLALTNVVSGDGAESNGGDVSYGSKERAALETVSAESEADSAANGTDSVGNEAGGTEESADAAANAVQPDVDSPSCIVMEVSTGEVLYEKDADNAMAPASVTKVMTLLLTFEAMDKGQFGLDDTVMVSEHAASMGGSQCFFEAGETQTVRDMIKCIIIASGNDAAVAMAEMVSGSETAFVQLMNERAAELGMTHTTFRNACGLDTDGHETTSRDIAVMSRQLIAEHPEILEYSTIWMDSIIHKTARGESQFDLVNTNKFLNMYTGATGLKTGYTSTAKYCMSATAERDGIQLIAVIMGAETKDIRNGDACTLLDYGYSLCRKYTDLQVLQENKIKIYNGTEKYVTIKADDAFEGILLGEEEATAVSRSLELDEPVKAPVKAGDVLGRVTYHIGDRFIGETDVTAAEDVPQMTMKYAFMKTLKRQFRY